MNRHFKREEMARCFRENGARCRECPLKQPADKLPAGCEENLEALVEDVLEPARSAYGMPIYVNSGYRCSIHNAAVGGASGSQHKQGEAADFRIDGAPGKLAKIIVANGKWDQLILYPTFVHVSWKKNGVNRKQILRKTASGYQKVNINELK